MQTLYLLDAYALIYRAYYALLRSPRINSKGQNTSAAYGFVNTLDDVIRTEKPDFIGIAFDPKGGTFRHEAYPEYKAQRVATPEDIRWAVPVIKDIIRAYRIPILEVPADSDTILKVGQNIKYDLTVLTNYGIDLHFPMFDTMLAHYLVQPELRHGMDYLAEVYLNYQTIHIEELIGPKGRGQKNMADLPPRDICDYACEDADVTLQLMAPLKKEMEDNGLTRVFEQIEMPLMPVLARMERNGVRLDTEQLAETGRNFNERLAEIEKEVYALAGHEFLITSPRQVGEVLFDELKLNEKARKLKADNTRRARRCLRHCARSIPSWAKYWRTAL